MDRPEFRAPMYQGLMEEYGHFHPEDRNRQNHTGIQITETYVVPTSISLIAGSGSGTVAGMQALLDGSVYTITEANGASPAANLEVTFARVPAVRWLYARVFYNGGSGHGVRFQLWNYGTSAWDTLDTVLPGVDYVAVFVPVPVWTQYISVGAAKVRVYHNEAGNPAHTITLDYLALVS